MRVRTAGEAIRLLVNDLQLTVSCVTQSVLRAQRTGDVVGITFGGPNPRAKVGRGQQRWIETNLAVEAREDDAETGTWRTHTLRYDFSLYDQEVAGHPLIAYHYHPDPDGRGVQHPHVHVAARPKWVGRDLAKIHLPTGRVACERFIRLLIQELGIRPGKADWERVITRTERRFQLRRTW